MFCVEDFVRWLNIAIDHETDRGRRWSDEIDERTGRRRSIVIREDTPRSERLAKAVVEVDRWLDLAENILDGEHAQPMKP